MEQSFENTYRACRIELQQMIQNYISITFMNIHCRWCGNKEEAPSTSCFVKGICKFLCLKRDPSLASKTNGNRHLLLLLTESGLTLHKGTTFIYYNQKN